MVRKKETLLELCTRATLQANSISVRLLEYLSTAKTQPHGFRELAVDFLDICRVLYSTEAGLREAARTKSQLPVDMVSELDKKFRQANDDFLVLNQMLLKFLEYDRKGTFGKLQKGFRMMFADTDIAKMRESLAKTRDALRMSAVVSQTRCTKMPACPAVALWATCMLKICRCSHFNAHIILSLGHFPCLPCLQASADVWKSVGLQMVSRRLESECELRHRLYGTCSGS